MKSLVAGGGGFIGGYLVKSLLEQGHEVVSADIKPIDKWCQFNEGARHYDSIDLRDQYHCGKLFGEHKFDRVYNLAADMGGMGFIENNKTACMLSVLINTNLLVESATQKVQNFMFASSACVYAHDKQTDVSNPGLKESDAYPAMAEDGYGWEKLFDERMCRHFFEDFKMSCTLPRFHNIYGPLGTYEGGREKAPAAICRKVVTAILSGKHEIEIWGDGEQTRSFTYIDDCITGINKLVDVGFREPINLGSSEMVSINQLVDMAETIGGVKLKRTYKLDAPKGVRGRNSDNTLLKSVLSGWEPSTKLYDGLEKTYKWIYDQIRAKQ